MKRDVRAQNLRLRRSRREGVGADADRESASDARCFRERPQRSNDAKRFSPGARFGVGCFGFLGVGGWRVCVCVL